MNQITICGNLGKDAEMRHLQDQTPVLSFSVADSQGRDKPSIWWNCAIFGKRAESLAQYLIKGQTVTVCGTVSERTWNDKQGVERKSMDIRVNDIALQGGKKEEAQAPAQRQSSARPAQRQAPSDDFPIDDVPF